MHTSILAAIQLRLLDPEPGVVNEATAGASTMDIVLPIVLDLTPNPSILTDDITITVSVTAGSATGM